MDPELQKQRSIVDTMKAQGRGYDAIVQYLRTQGYESVGAWNAAVRAADAAAAQPGNQPARNSSVPGATGMAAFGADPNYFGVLSDATRDVTREMAQPVTFGYADELESKLTGTPHEQIAAEREAVPTPVKIAAQAPGTVLMGLGSGAATRAAIPKTAGLARSAASTLGLTGAEGWLYGSGMSDPGQRVEGGNEGAMWSLALGLPLIGGGNLLQYLGTQRAIAKGDINAADLVRNAMGVDPSTVPVRPGQTFAEGMGPRIGGRMLRSAAGSLDDFNDIRRYESLWGSRQAQVPLRLSRGVDQLMPGTVPTRTLPDGRVVTGRTAPATAVYQSMDPEQVPGNVIDALMGAERASPGIASRQGARVSDLGLPDPSDEIGRPLGGFMVQPKSATWEQAMRVERNLRKADDLPEITAHRALRSSMEEADDRYREAQALYAKGKTAESLDKALNQGDPKKVFAPLRKPELQRRVTEQFGPEAAKGFQGLVDLMENQLKVSEMGLQGLGTSSGFLAERTWEAMRGNFTQLMTAVAYSLNRMFGASARTMIQGNLGGTEGGRKLARQLVELIGAIDGQETIRALNAASDIPGQIASRSAFRGGLLGNVGARIGGLLGGR